MESYIQTAIGIAVSLVLFWLSYRQTIGAKKERTQNANKAMHRAIMRRMVLEEYSPKYKDLSRVREGKAREFNTSHNDMLSEEQVLNTIYTEVFDSDLISPSQRTEIEGRLDALFVQIESKTTKATIDDYRLLKDSNDRKKQSLIAMSSSVSAVGAAVSILFTYLRDPSAIDVQNLQWLFSGLGVFVLSLIMITYLGFIRKEKDSVAVPARSKALLNALNFEIEVAKAIEKSGVQYTTEPKIGNFRPDFILSMNNQKIAVEAKPWEDSVPLSLQAHVIRRLEAMAELQEVDSVLLVTKKPQPSRGLTIENSKVSVISFNEFGNQLKKARAA